MQETEMEPVQQEYTFALDIGTRSVIGIVGRMQRGVFNVVDTEYAEHDKRAMFDGQIEDIEQVARIAGLVKDRLEARLGVSFNNVCVAAAGRALRTCASSFDIELDPDEPVTNQNIYQLEMGAIGIAQDTVNANENIGEGDIGLFCVGHSVTGYYLDDYRMTTILGHKGRSARAEVIATFLPNQVVDSLRSAMALINLNIINITLEPIAAMNAVIPAELRLLNLALVDIGAGTSDIAISDSGSVVAYTMATIAGDEITEYLMKRYLIDFATAEKLKAAASGDRSEVSYTDILGFGYNIAASELLDALATPVSALAEEICNRITACNDDKSPVAVFLVGGGSKVPMLGTAVAERLGIDASKVAVGGSAFMKKQTSGQVDVSDPEYATPLGIAITAASYAEHNSMHVFVNDNKVQMLRSAGYTVMNALLMCGYKYPQLMGKSGRSIRFGINGESLMVRGGLPRPAEITVNDKPASIATALENGDRIIIMPSLSGADAEPHVGDYTKSPDEPTVTLDGIPCCFGELAMIDGKQVRRDRVINHNDEITTRWVCSLGELCADIGMVTEGRHFTANGERATLDFLLRDGDVILSEDDSYSFDDIKEIADSIDASAAEPAADPIVDEAVAIELDGVELVPEQDIAEAVILEAVDSETRPEASRQPENTGNLPTICITLNQRSIELPPKEDKTPYLFLDMLNLVDIDPTKPEGDIVLRVNSQNASYLQEIHQGDSIQIYWSSREE